MIATIKKAFGCRYLRGALIAVGVVVVLLMVAVENNTNAQNIVDLEQALNEGKVALENTKGTGRSSGSVIKSELHNLTNRALKIFTHIGQGLFLRNGGVGQNMIATEIYHSSGQYWVENGKNIIKVDANGREDIVLVAYCVDFEKNNPTPQERFSISSIPRNFEHVLRDIQAYRERYPDKDITVPAQVALWFSKGYTLREIRKKFAVSSPEAELATQLTQ
ncbi:hypothetical protein [Candidatus Spongiihabitans sp.]|uniref:hypothetical protein n=1 Tax=Candidatus Spongiihabitans sp. TaxID=3101308 RepID=UPI003C7AC2E1